MKDVIIVNPAQTASTIDGLVTPAEDGTFVIRAIANHQGNNQGAPSMQLIIKIDDAVDYASKRVSWADGPAVLQGATTEFMRKGQQYSVSAESPDWNANATGISMTIERA